MSKVCISKNKFVIIPNAEHGLAYPTNPELYISKVKEFIRDRDNYLVNDVFADRFEFLDEIAKA